MLTLAEPTGHRKPRVPRLPSIRQRELGIALRESREAAGLKNTDVAARLEVHPSTITKWEKAERRPQPRDLIALGTLYGWSPERTDELKAMARAAETSGFWQSPNLEEKTRSYLSLEAGASSISNYEIAVVPGIMQARDYATAVFAATRPRFSEERIRANVDLRLRRIKVLQGEKPTAFHAIIDESVLCRPFGGGAAMRAQLELLLKLSDYSNITIQILGFSAATSEAQNGPFAILDFTSLPSYAYMEGQIGQIFQDDPEEVAACREAFATIASLAESPRRSAEMIRTHLAKY